MICKLLSKGLKFHMVCMLFYYTSALIKVAYFSKTYHHIKLHKPYTECSHYSFHCKHIQPCGASEDFFWPTQVWMFHYINAAWSVKCFGLREYVTIFLVSHESLQKHTSTPSSFTMNRKFKTTQLFIWTLLIPMQLDEHIYPTEVSKNY